MAVAAKSMTEQEFSTRLFRAWYLYQLQKGGSATQEWLGKRVGKFMGIEPVSQSAVSRWFRGATPDLETIRALAQALEVDPGWLAFGNASQAPGPEDPFGGRLKKL